MDTDSCIIHVKTDDIYRDTKEDVQIFKLTDHYLKEKIKM